MLRWRSGRFELSGQQDKKRKSDRGGKISPTIMANQSEICKMEIIGKSGLPASQEEIDGIREESRHKRYRIRKLTPLECYRLMGVSDENAKKMLDVNSNTQCYKQAGNSIVVPVLMALFSQMNIDGVRPWNEMTEDEIYELIDSHK